VVVVSHSKAKKSKPTYVYNKLDEKFKLYHKLHSAETGQKEPLQQIVSKPEAGKITGVLKHFNPLHHGISEPKRGSAVKIDEKIPPKKEIISERVHFVSPRGDKVIITDEELAGLGIRSILFEL